MKEVMDKIFEELRAISPEEFQARLDEVKDSELCKAMKELDEFSEWLFEQDTSL